MDISFAGQTLSFFISLAMGVLLCLFYDVFRIIRLAGKPSALSVFFQDIFYFFVCGLLTYCLLLVRCQGEMRGYVLFGELCGFLLCRYTVSQLIIAVSSQIIRFFAAIKRVLLRFIFKPIKKFFRNTAKHIRIGTRKIYSFFKIVMNNSKKHLKASVPLVYNRRHGVESNIDNDSSAENDRAGVKDDQNEANRYEKKEK